MSRPVCFIWRTGDDCALVEICPDGREKILEQGLTLAEAEEHFASIGESVHEPAAVDDDDTDEDRSRHRRPGQLAFRF